VDGKRFEDRDDRPTAEVDAPTQARQVERMASRGAVLIVLSGANVGRVIRLDVDAMTLGRDARCEACVPDEGMSRRHSRLTFLPDRTWEIRDLGSTNGTVVNGERVERRVLRDGDRLLLGHTVLRFFAQADVDDEYLRQTYELSVRDGLTAAYNRRFFDDRLAAEAAFARRHRTLLSLLMVDIDHFKQVNDRHGHTAGDEVLREVAAAMRQRIRAEDVLARYVGEEFCLLARGIPPEGAFALAERLRRGVEGLVVKHGWSRISVTVSVGAATVHGHPGLREEALLEAADRLLYEAKEAGRNRTCARLLPAPADDDETVPRRERTTKV
jgi:diguanylate cyclase (GGDEF)-like protein